MALKTGIYIDGENLRKALSKFNYPNPRRVGSGFYLRERLVNWTSFFTGIIEKIETVTAVNHRLAGARWYLANQVRVVADSNRKRAKCLSDCQTDVPQMTERELVSLSEAWVERERTRVRKESEEIRADLEKNYDYLEFIYVGEFLLGRYEKYQSGVNPDGSLKYAGKYIGERGVDLGMAVDMVTQSQYLDAVVIVR